MAQAEKYSDKAFQLIYETNIYLKLEKQTVV